MIPHVELKKYLMKYYNKIKINYNVKSLQIVFYSIFISTVVLFATLQYISGEFVFDFSIDLSSAIFRSVIIVLFLNLSIGFDSFYLLLRVLKKDNIGISSKIFHYKTISIVRFLSIEASILICIHTYFSNVSNTIYLLLVIILLLLTIFIYPKSDILNKISFKK